MTKVICFTRLDGGMSFILPAPKEQLERVLGPLTDEAYWAHIYERNAFQLDTATNIHEIEHADLPHQDRDFRNAWVTDGAAVTVDMPKAREIHKDKLRSMRAPLLLQLDADWFVADGRPGGPAAKATINNKKQALRDVTDDPAIEAAKTPDELKPAIPPILQGA